MMNRGAAQRTWTPYEEDFLREWYRDLGAEACAERIGRTIQVVQERARVLGINRRRAPQKSTPRHVGPREEPLPAPPPPKPSAVYDSGFIRQPTKAQLMGRRA